ncbi:hypothetical protein [Bacteroides congonensis]|uniref:hypothetical protein n=1 Tax=Bacteroides congonensis TaxID=1871006 RepID=UPI001E37F309|nr:hypothetical protein [Bacteroides congonensis]
MKKKDRFVCWIWVAPFVKQYLLTNFKVYDPDWPELVNISQDKSLDVMFRSRLVKPSNRYDKRISQSGSYKYRNCKVALEITKSDFYHHGWSLSPTDEAALANAMEIRCRTILLTYLSVAYMVKPNLSICIQQFYDTFHFDESTWPSDSIRRIWNRDTTIDKNALKSGIEEKINKIILVQLFKNGTISQSGKEIYENNSI